MGTNKPKLQGYIDPKLYDAYSEWKEKNYLQSESQALNQLLLQFFFGGDNVIPQSSTEDQLKPLIQGIVAESIQELSGKSIA